MPASPPVWLPPASELPNWVPMTSQPITGDDVTVIRYQLVSVRRRTW